MKYEKKYNEALKRAKAYHRNELAGSRKEMMEYIFPELRESEDERIRRTLVEYFGHYNPEDKWDDEFSFKEVLSYLEKQKEQKPAEWSEEDERHLIWLCRIIHNRVVNKELSLAEESELGKWIDKWINHEPQPVQKWDEFDEDCLKRAIWYVENPAPSVVKDTNLVLWLKSLRPQSHKEIYQAAKRDLAIKFMNYLDENRPNGKMSLSNGECEDIDKAFKENDWAKILRYAEKYGKEN